MAASAVTQVRETHITLALQGPVNCRVRMLRLFTERLILAGLLPIGQIEKKRYVLPMRLVNPDNTALQSPFIQESHPLLLAEATKATTLFNKLMLTVVGPNPNNPKKNSYQVEIPPIPIGEGTSYCLVVSQAGERFIAQWEEGPPQERTKDPSYQLRSWIGTIATTDLLRTLGQDPLRPISHPNLDQYTIERLNHLLGEAIQAYIQAHADYQEASCQENNENEEIADRYKRSVSCVIVRLSQVLYEKGERQMPSDLLPYRQAIYRSVSQLEGPLTLGLDLFTPNGRHPND